MENLDDILALARSGRIDEFESAVASVNDSSVQHWLRASHADLLGDARVAIDAYRQALNQPNVADFVATGAGVRICANLRRAGEVDASIIEGESHLLALLIMSPYPLDDVIELKSILANIYSSRGEMSRAISLTEEQPPHTETGILRAQWGWSRSVVLFQAGYIDEAITTAIEASAVVDRKSHPSFVVGIESNIWWMRSVNGERFDDVEMATIESRIDDEVQLDRRFMADELTLSLAFARANRGENAESIALIGGLRERSNLSGAGMVRAATVLNAAGDNHAAQSTYRDSLGLLDAELEPVLVASIWRTLATSYEAEGDIGAALECLKAATEAAGIVSSPNADPLCINY